MLKKRFFILLIFLCAFINILKAGTDNPFRDSINVLHYDIHLNMRNIVNQQISGYTDVTLKTRSAKMDMIYLDLLALSVDSVFIENRKQEGYDYNDSLLVIPTFGTITPKDTVMLRIYYHGEPVQDNSWGGFYFSAIDAFNMGVGMSSNPVCFGRVWFPCNDSFTDKATYDYYITVRSRQKAVCGGTLSDVKVNNNGTTTYHWHLPHDIPTYLASVAVSDYTEISYLYEGMGKKTPVSIFTYPADKEKAEKSFSTLNTALKAFENAFGPYRWDRIGFVEVSFNSGAMEHATNIAFPKFAFDGTLRYENLITHELSHSWFGNLVTCASEADMWLNEGWASYCESVYMEYAYGKQKFKEYQRNQHRDVLQNTYVTDRGYLPVYGIPHRYTYGSTVYHKGADVVHTLRGYLGDDIFFSVIKSYLEKYAYSNISTAEFKEYLSKYTGIDLKDFFNFWVYSPGFPHFSVASYSVNPHVKDYEVQVKIKQRLKGGREFSRSNKIDITFADNRWNFYTTVLNCSGEIDSATIKVPFKPEIIMLDLDEKIADCTTDSYKIIKSAGDYQFDNSYFTLNVIDVKDSIFFRVEHNWIAPDKLKKSLPNYIISADRFWKIDAIQVKKARTEGRFSFEINTNLDNTFSSSKPDQKIVLMYRKDNADDWHEINSKREGTSQRGLLKVRNVLPGEYTLAVKN